MLAIVIDLAKLGDPTAIGPTSRQSRRISAHRESRRGSTRCCCRASRSGGRAERSATGIPVDATTWHDIREAAAKLGITEAEIERAVGAN